MQINSYPSFTRVIIALILAIAVHFPSPAQQGWNLPDPYPGHIRKP
jgi:hypothetical protein